MLEVLGVIFIILQEEVLALNFLVSDLLLALNFSFIKTVLVPQNFVFETRVVLTLLSVQLAGLFVTVKLQ